HCTPLHIAALQSSVEAAEVIVRDSPKVVERTHRESPSALSPLHIAILCGSHAMVELLLDGKANPNVLTLHGVSPLHLAATTSKELCQLLVAYAAEPALHDVMGSSTLHYAATFKQHEVLDILLQGPQASRLVLEGDQKRVTPLHLACALYNGTTDLAGPMRLLAAGAKPWQADV
ncbi:Serine/threonine-protein kinase TNNI3K (Cardiac ankyrin repeat kinase) (TNNI3-interacting kinase), partial [Durusdinium trenchii]